MEDNTGPESDAAPGRGAGAMLAEARAKAKLDLADVAARTRIPQRHLAAIEAGEYAKLPSRTYAVGFSRTYARLLGLDERQVIEQVRIDLAEGDPQGTAPRHDRFEPGDPARVPSSRLAWLSALAILILIVGAYSFYRTYFSPSIGPAPLADPTPTTTATPGLRQATPAASASGPVVFTSLADGTWIKFYDGSGKRLFEGQMAKGQSFTVPAEAVEPQAWTGRPNAFAITVGGRPVAKLSDTETIMKDVPVTAQALTSRPAATPTAPASPVMAPATPPAT